jgi:hypothetical protein
VAIQLTQVLSRLDRGLAVQTISRFYVAYHLTTLGILAPGATVLSVCGPGLTLDYLRVDDLNLAEQVKSGMSKQSLFFAQSARESCILDAVHMVGHPVYSWEAEKRCCC